MNKLISYFSSRSLFVNVIFFGILLLAIFMWRSIGKEEMPEFESNWVRVTTSYPGASAEDVELFVTKELEDELKSVVGIEEISSTSSTGSSRLRIVLDDDYPDLKEVVQDIKDAVLRVNLPSEVRNIPSIRQFKSSEKAIMDIGLYIEGQRRLNQESREELQRHALAFEQQIVALDEISSISKSHYLKPELQVLVDPKKSQALDVPLTLIERQIKSNNLRRPIGSINDRDESKVSLINEYEDVESFSDLVVRTSYEGKPVKLSEVADVKKGFEKNLSIFKVNGHEAVFLNVKKSISTDILAAQKKVLSFVEKYKKNNLDNNVKVVLMDDESFDVRNRLSIVTSNAILGFFLILLVLFVFMDLQSSFWVAMGIPFCTALTLIGANFIGYTVNNMTLAGIIIVLGVVVDDAIIIAENITRHKESGMPSQQAAVLGSQEVFKPILFSIITTCIAFLPLIYFEGFFGKLVSYIPIVVILMLVASLFESVFMLPSHLATAMKKPAWLENLLPKGDSRVWFKKYEGLYNSFLYKVLLNRKKVLSCFLILLVGAVALFHTKMKFVMFPREESKEVVIKVMAKKGALRDETAKLIQPIEDLFASDKENIVGVRASIAQSRRGSQVRENAASILVELHPADQRKMPLSKLLKEWEAKTKDLPGIESVKFIKGRWGNSSGSGVEIQIQQNNDVKRELVANELKKRLEAYDHIEEVEIERPLTKNEFIFSLKQEKLMRLKVTPDNVARAMRSYVEGSILYSINKGDEEVDVKLGVPQEELNNLEGLKDIRVENSSGNFIKLSELVNIKSLKKPSNIVRSDYKRSVMIYADLKKGTKVTPLQIAQDLEEKDFPEILRSSPTTVLKFKGEIEDSRESQGEFLNSVIIVIIGIYLVLVVMFNSLSKPLLILGIIPFGLAGVIFILYFHGMSVYGFFAAIGALGMIGVVVNDAIVMIDKLDKAVSNEHLSLKDITSVATTRLRPIILTTLTTVIGVLPTAYGFAGYDSILAEMMLTMGWGLAFGTLITLILIPICYSYTLKNIES